MIDFRSLETFVWVAELGSFRGAAAKLATTQPAVSQRIAQLEGRLGVRLLDRQRRAVVPTEKGRQLLAYAERLLRLRAEMVAAVGDPAALTGTVRLGVAETIVHTWLPALVERLAAAHPRLSLEIEVDISPSLRDRLVAHEIDLAFLLGPISAPQVVNRALCRFPVAFVACPSLKLPRGVVPFERLAERPLVTFARGTRPYLALRALLARFDLPLRLHASASLATVVRMALDGIGVAVIPPAIVARELADGRLRIVRSTVEPPGLTFTASWPMTPDDAAAEAVAAIAVEVATAHGDRPASRRRHPAQG